MHDGVEAVLLEFKDDGLFPVMAWQLMIEFHQSV